MGSDSKLLTSLFCLRVSEDMTWCVVGKLIEMPFIFRPRTHGMDKGSNYKTHTHTSFLCLFSPVVMVTFFFSHATTRFYVT